MVRSATSVRRRALSTSASAGSRVERVVSEIHPCERVHEHAAREHRDADVRRLRGPVRGPNRTGFDGVEPKGAVGIGRDSGRSRRTPDRAARGRCRAGVDSGRARWPARSRRARPRSGCPTPSSTRPSMRMRSPSVRSLTRTCCDCDGPRQADPEERAHGLRRCLPRRRHQRASIGVSSAAQHDVEAVAERDARFRDVVIVARR